MNGPEREQYLTRSDAIGKINQSFENHFRRTDEGFEPYVCLICDRILPPSDVRILELDLLESNAIRLQRNAINNTPEDLAACYRFDKPIIDAEDPQEDWIQNLLLSPRAAFIDSDELSMRSRSTGFTVCPDCIASLKKHQTPKFAIANNYATGTPPPCILELWDIELALITPVKTHGWCFSYTGGTQKKLKGSLSYYKVKMEDIALAGAHLDVLGLHNNVVVLLYGSMTPEQRERARQKNKIRPNKILAALRWLLDHNEQWKQSNINLDELARNLQNPVLIDDSTEVASGSESANNVERTESFQVFFPDGTTHPLTGGQNNMEEFRQVVQSASQRNYDLEFQCDLRRDAVNDYADNNLVNACLKQFPYGRGGLTEPRLKGDGGITESVDPQEYADHLSRLSQRYYHEELFVLIMYNMCVKQKMLKRAWMKVGNKMTARDLTENLTDEDIGQALQARIHGTDQGTTQGSTFLRSIDAVTAAAPHTNGATRKAQRDGEAMQHHFAMPSYFLTVTPDDDNSFLVQVLSGEIVDDDQHVSNLTDEELAKRAKRRTEIRLRCPGLCAIYYEWVIDIVYRELIGWDLKKNAPIPGAKTWFGKPIAHTLSTEEQGRLSCHGHIMLWVEGFVEWQKQLHSSRRATARAAEQKIASESERVGSCSLYFPGNENDGYLPRVKAFPHQCAIANMHDRRPPEVVDDQQLRNLRHFEGHNSESGAFLKCPHCPRIWTNKDALESYLINHVKVPGLTALPDVHTRRLKAMCVQAQRAEDGNTGAPPTRLSQIIDAAYNHHGHTTSSCFGKFARKRKRDQNSGNNTETQQRASRKRKLPLEECRYRLPQREHRTTAVQNASEDVVEWASWTGEIEDRQIKEICPKRRKLDAFQNNSCPAISHSKLACNTNIAVILDGAIGVYTFKYVMKETQEEDQEEYNSVRKVAKSVLANRRHQSDMSEATRLLLAASHAHKSENVCGSPLASTLIRNGSRFRISHSFRWVPVRDIGNMLESEEAAHVTIQRSGNGYIFQCEALNYLCRPTQCRPTGRVGDGSGPVVDFESMSPFDFFSKFQVRKARDDTSYYKLHNHGNFKHPSSNQDGTFKNGVYRRNYEVLPKIFQYDFEDTASFGANLFDPQVTPNESMERYSRMVLLLFYHYRSKEDLLEQNSFTLKLRQVKTSGGISNRAQTFLQNVQDVKSNAFRAKCEHDDLQRNTSCYNPRAAALPEPNEDSDDEDDDDRQMTRERLEELLRQLDTERNSNPDEADNQVMPTTLDLNPIRRKGVDKCGYDQLANLSMQPTNADDPFVHTPNQARQQNNEDPQERDNNQAAWREHSDPTQTRMSLVCRRTTRRRRDTFLNRFYRSNPEEYTGTLEANGTAKSIMDWAITAGLDQNQRRAFEVTAGSFVLSFYRNAPLDPNQPQGAARTSSRHVFAKEKVRLERLVEKRKRGSDQLICFLHGAAGSGKTAILDLLIEYAKEYCENLDYPWTPMTIVITAMTGVAATLLMGDTTHKAVHLNQRKPITADQVQAWLPTRMVIVDEISFAGSSELEKLDANLSTLKQCRQKRYGGIDIIFAGDMRQLEPIGDPNNIIYRADCPEFRNWVNCYLEINGLHRFKDDPEWGELLSRFRNGQATLADIARINERVVRCDTILPDDIRYATYFNRDRDSINTGLFAKHCRNACRGTNIASDSLVVFCDNLKCLVGSTYEPFRNRTSFYENCGEDDIRKGKHAGRMDPMLKLIKGGRMMIPANIDVSKGQANGTQTTVQRAILKPGERPERVQIERDVWVNAVGASQIDHVVLKHCNERVHPSEFSVKPVPHTFTANLLKPRSLRTKENDRQRLQMKGVQLPLLMNDATTGHKLQGSGVNSLFVHKWSYKPNWAYVMLSRVKTRNGLFLRHSLKSDLRLYAIHPALEEMLKGFEPKRPSYWAEEEYDEMLNS